MRLVTDLHLHGKYAHATSKDLTLPMLSKYAGIKGVDILGTGDFQHPKWNQHLKEMLIEIDGTGIYSTTRGQKFILQSEISLVFTQGGKGRRVHLVILAPSFEIVSHIQEALLKRGRIDYDGRPTFGISCVEFVELMRSISPDIEVIPAHAWTPWFGVFGSKSGFDSLKDCFLDKTKHIHAIETGLSSDPPMNWRLAQLDGIQLISSSDSHSYWPWRVGREATIFELKEITYKAILHAIRTGEGLACTIETDPGYGIYHFDGHRECKVSYSPEESKNRKGTCEKCGKQVTVGVAARVDQLADRPSGFKPKNAKPYTNLIPLSELISGVYGVGLTSKKTWEVYNKLINRFDTEFAVLLDATQAQLSEVVDASLVDVILKNRNQQIRIKPGYDGVYGVPIIGDRALEIEQRDKSGMQETSKKTKTLDEY